ncbi:MAG: hypothetical protein HY036_11265 [Nitrospirae bacterium]|nr:hypothetical protein [Nitrospirota bacterium]MBI3353141.1 hypothetical protein [Nitrospirota bacterium]
MKMTNVKQEIEAPFSGKIVTFIVGKTHLDLESKDSIESKSIRRAPNYPEVVPKQKILRVWAAKVDQREAQFLLKAYLPNIIIVEASIFVDNFLSPVLFEIKRTLLSDCRKVLEEFKCQSDFDEEYSVYCISKNSGDRETFMSEHGGTIASLLKNERMPLDEEEIKKTLETHIKYGIDDLSIVDWDGAFLIDPKEDFEPNIELFEIANYQLLKSRILDDELDNRLKLTASFLNGKNKRIFFGSKLLKRLLKEIIQIRTESILESASIEQNIKLIGDWYSARLYQLISKKFHLEDWGKNINEKLDTLEDVYVMASENFSISFRTTLEFILIGGWFILLLGWFFLFYLDLHKGG